MNQNDLRSDLYHNISEAVLKGDVQGSSTGKIILPSSVTGSPRYMINNYQDAMAICRAYGNPDLFITLTCNTNWPEIQRELNKNRTYKYEDKPDIITRIFRSNLLDMFKFIKSGVPFGKTIADVYAIEFQNRGLPHTHILIWLAPEFKFKTSDDIDSIVSAEIPDKNIDPLCHEIVSKFMIHGPCGVARPGAQCMSANNGIMLFNDYVVPYNKELLVRYNAHINVEICCQSMLIKYLFKYVSKGPYRCRAILQNDTDDEIQAYLNCRFICPYEQNIVFSGNESLQSVLRRPGIRKTMLTEWFEYNKKNSDARELYYSEFPNKYVWDFGQKEWIVRSKGLSLGRIAYVHPAAGELYFLDMVFADLDIRECLSTFSLLAKHTALEMIKNATLQDHNLSMPDGQLLKEITNKLLREELNYDLIELKNQHSLDFASLNHGQRALIFVHGHGGIGKTFLWHTIINRLRSEGLIVLAVASSGIASLLLPNGRTTHSRFKIPLAIDESSTCAIKKNTHLSNLLQKTSLIVWDEAPMINRFCFEALNRSMQDVIPEGDNCGKDLPFGGKTILLGGDFCQILPVIPGGTKEQIINASLTSSTLWSRFNVLTLTENMRLSTNGLTSQEKADISEFSKWILNVGNGDVSDLPSLSESDDYFVVVPSDLLLQPSCDPISAIVSTIYPNISDTQLDPCYF
uniref:ATP-dependent DNA helicase n=1 Tax=Salix viminalis TaxID=40686 RepID=A0A6N2KK71_SALVM